MDQHTVILVTSLTLHGIESFRRHLVAVSNTVLLPQVSFAALMATPVAEYCILTTAGFEPTFLAAKTGISVGCILIGPFEFRIYILLHSVFPPFQRPFLT